VAVPEFRDDLSYTHGKHSLTFGTDIKPIRLKVFQQSDRLRGDRLDVRAEC